MNALSCDTQYTDAVCDKSRVVYVIQCWVAVYVHFFYWNIDIWNTYVKWMYGAFIPVVNLNFHR